MLSGERVRLRPLEASDLDRCLGWINDAELRGLIAVRYPMSRAAEEEWLTRVAAPPPGGELTYAIETLTDGRHIGNLGLHDLERENRNAVFGILIGERDCWDRGYGRDAILTLLRFAFDEMNLHRVSLVVFEHNHRAIACYRKCGFVQEGRLRQDAYQGGRYIDSLVMAILADEFRELHGSAAGGRA